MENDEEGPWPNDALLEERVNNFVQTHSLIWKGINDIKQQRGESEQSIHKMSLDDLINLSERSHAPNMVIW